MLLCLYLKVCSQDNEILPTTINKIILYTQKLERFVHHFYLFHRKITNFFPGANKMCKNSTHKSTDYSHTHADYSFN